MVLNLAKLVRLRPGYNEDSDSELNGSEDGDDWSEEDYGVKAPNPAKKKKRSLLSRMFNSKHKRHIPNGEATAYPEKPPSSNGRMDIPETSVQSNIVQILQTPTAPSSATKPVPTSSAPTTSNHSLRSRPATLLSRSSKSPSSSPPTTLSFPSSSTRPGTC